MLSHFPFLPAITGKLQASPSGITGLDACLEQYSQDKFIQLPLVKSSWIISYDKVLTGNPVGPVHEIYTKELVSIRDDLLGDCILLNFTVFVIVIVVVVNETEHGNA
ncbi:hypothetical protein NC651_030635 [Populus alba x Populus x berolinensis]|nr:hypothetical protein NC651_030635 [Populus alba x Populus x berolinensis]